MTEHRVTGTRRAKLAFALTAGMALVGTLIGYSQPDASAAPQTKYYGVSVSTAPITSTSAQVTVQVVNESQSTQSFGSAEITFSNFTPASISATPSNGSAWVLLPGTAAGTYIFTSGNSVAILPGNWLDITFDIDTTGAYLVSFTTQVKQSNDFSGNGNNFINTTGDPVLTNYQDAQVCSGTCDVPTSGSLSSQQTFGGVPATGSAVINGPKTNYIAAGSFDVTASLLCDQYVDTVGDDPLTVVTPGTTSTYGTVSITLPKYVVNNQPSNGTPLMQVCGQASHPFNALTPTGAPTTSQSVTTSAGTTEYYGLLPDCPSGVSGNTNPSKLNIPTGDVLLCVLSRSKNAANETIVIYVSDFSDPSFW